jgi:hypothetical protein
MPSYEGKAEQPWLSVEELIAKALQTLKTRGVTSEACPRCHTDDWNVDILDIPAKSAMSKLLLFATLGAEYSQSDFIPVLTLVCKNCGYTMFHNLKVLGIAEGGR